MRPPPYCCCLKEGCAASRWPATRCPLPLAPPAFPRPCVSATCLCHLSPLLLRQMLTPNFQASTLPAAADALRLERIENLGDLAPLRAEEPLPIRARAAAAGWTRAAAAAGWPAALLPAGDPSVALGVLEGGRTGSISRCCSATSAWQLPASPNTRRRDTPTPLDPPWPELSDAGP